MEKEAFENFTKDDLIEFLAKNRIYPVWSKNGKIFLLNKNGLELGSNKTEKILSILNIKTEEECKTIRKEIKEKAKAFNTHIPVKKWVKNERPRERLIENGAENLRLSELLAIILRIGREGESAEELARKVLNKFKTLRALDSATIEEIREIDGIGIAKATQIKAALEIGKRFIREKAEARRSLKTPREVSQYVYESFAPYLRDKNKEFFIVILLDIKNKPLKNIEISKGSVNASIVDTKEIVQAATINLASSVILVHNHPSGDTTPSKEDVVLTEQIKNACNLVNVKVLDHIILGKNSDDFFSFVSAGLL